MVIFFSIICLHFYIYIQLFVYYFLCEHSCLLYRHHEDRRHEEYDRRPRSRSPDRREHRREDYRREEKYYDERYKHRGNLFKNSAVCLLFLC